MKRHFMYPLLSLLLASPLWTIAQEPLATKEGTIRSLEEQERMAVLKEDVARAGTTLVGCNLLSTILRMRYQRTEMPSSIELSAV